MQVMDHKSWWVLIFNLRSYVCWVQEKRRKKSHIFRGMALNLQQQQNWSVVLIMECFETDLLKMRTRCTSNVFVDFDICWCTAASVGLFCDKFPPFFGFNPPSAILSTHFIYPCSREIAAFITERAVSKSTGSTHQPHNKRQSVMIYAANEID